MPPKYVTALTLIQELDQKILLRAKQLQKRLFSASISTEEMEIGFTEIHELQAEKLALARKIDQRVNRNLEMVQDGLHDVRAKIRRRATVNLLQYGENGKYCYCQGPGVGKMIGCDGKCALDWFHFRCADCEPPTDENAKWYCPDCKMNLEKMSIAKEYGLDDYVPPQ